MSVILLIVLTVFINYGDLRAINKNDTNNINDDCKEVPDMALTQILGPAYNTRYMSINAPMISNDDADGGEDPTRGDYSMKRKANNALPFYVDDTFHIEISNKPAWEVNHIQKYEIRDSKRSKRQAYRNNGRSRGSNTQPQRPWECEARIKWIDLGLDYFPRYLRTVECTKHLCWYGHFTCQPRSFTVKVLRRRRGQCVRSDRLKNIVVEGLPGELRELWVWEERAVNFCCDCAAKKH